ncbi:MAG: hypothetical protein L3K15_00140 [Thermoplasmata archaeon]|nr:hypothetical protein [Thermoplasmata archaeon]
MILTPISAGTHPGASAPSAVRGTPAAPSESAGAVFAGSTGQMALRAVTSPLSSTTADSASLAAHTAPLSGGGVTVGTHFPGISSANSSCGCAPPDIQVAVGPSHVVEMVNLEGKVWTKAGVVKSSFTLATFFATGTDFTSDPKVIWDNLSSRWIATLLDVTTGNIHVAMSKTSSPLAGWNVYTLGSAPSGDFPDQPILGVSSDLVVIGGNDYVTATSAFVGGQVWALNKSTMLTGALTYYNFFGPHAYWFSMHPVHSISATMKAYLVMGSGSSSVKVFSITGKPGATTHATLSAATTLAVTAFSAPPAAPQKGTVKKIDTSDTRMQDAVWKAGVLWLTFDTGCIPTGDATTRSCVRLIQLSTVGPPSVVQEFNLAKYHTYLFYGALAMDGASNVVVAYGYSNGTVYPSFAVTAHLAGSPLGSLLPSVTLVTGTASATVACTFGVCRWGDYYGAGADPSSPNIWIAGEYATTTTHWSTWISQVRA